MEPENPSQCPCEENMEALFAYLEESLAPDEKKRIERHIETCEPCRKFVAEIRCIIQVCREESKQPVADPEVIDRIKQRIRKRCAGDI